MEIKRTLEKQLQSNLDKWRAEIDRAEAKAAEDKADAEASQAKADLQKQLWSEIDDLKSKVKDAEEWLVELKDATEGQVTKIREDIGRLVA